MKVSKETKKILFFCEGGIGKNICATAVIRAIKKQYPDKDIIVIAGCPEVFFHNPNVKRTYNFGNPLYFYEDNIANDSVVFRIEPYYHPDYISKKKHLVECWCEMYGVKLDGVEPDIFLTPNENDSSNKRIKEVAKNKKYCLIQWAGGKIPEAKTDMKHKEALAHMFRRALKQETVQKIVDKLKDKYYIGIVGSPNYPTIKDTEVIFHPIRNSISLVNQADLIIGIDSWVQHAAAAFKKKALVLWGGTSPVCLGYSGNLNKTKEKCSTPFCHRPNSYLMDLQPNGSIWDCPYGEPCLDHTADEILGYIKKEI